MHALRTHWLLHTSLALAVALAPAFASASSRILAHRAGELRAPENTVAAIEGALDDGAWGVEIDLQWSLDEVVVVIHDFRVERTTDGTGEVRQLTRGALQALDAGSWFDALHAGEPGFRGPFAGERIPTLAEALQAVKDRGGVALLDFKGGWLRSGMRPKVAEVLDALDFWDGVIASAFTSLPNANEIRSDLPGVPVAFIAGDPQALAAHHLERYRDAGVSIVLVDHNLDAPFVQLAQSLGLAVMVGNVNNAIGLQKMFALGVDYVDTIDPVLASSVRPTCNDGIDNDGDGLIDYPADPGCVDYADPFEVPPCSDGMDNDGDGATDYPSDSDCAAPDDVAEGVTACNNGLDDDGDGFADHPDDLGCPYLFHISEISGTIQCDDGIDNDGDGRVDHPADPECSKRFDGSEAARCENGVDDDGDGLVDWPDDPGCRDAKDESEAMDCEDGFDDDGDGLADWPDDPGCDAPSDPDEHAPALACDDGIDRDGDGLADWPADPGCQDLFDASERSPALVCDDGIDNDDDGAADFPADPACPDPTGRREDPACQDGIDNDGDGLIDWDGADVGEPDPDCQSLPWGQLEQPRSCGVGFELILLVPFLAALRRRRRSESARRPSRPASPATQLPLRDTHLVGGIAGAGAGADADRHGSMRLRMGRLSGSLVCGVGCLLAPLAASAFAVVAIPDTQKYVGASPIPALQTQWIVDNRASWKIAFATHLGDVVDEVGQTDRWLNISAAMQRLDGVVPYSVVIGNHDYDLPPGGGPATIFQSHFGAGRYDGFGWFGGTSPTGISFFQIFHGDGYAFLHLGLELHYLQPAVLSWAQSVLDAHPALPVIVTTHAYVDVGGRYFEGEALWNQFVKRNRQIFLVLNGHFLEPTSPPGDAEYAQVSVNDFGLDVIEMLANYQQRPNGGNGWLRLIEIHPLGDEVRFHSYSPYLNAWETDANSEFSIPFDLSSRLAQACDDGLDNDGDGGVDWDGGGVGPSDPQCSHPWLRSEAGWRCGLGFELGFVLPVLLALYRRGRGVRRSSAPTSRPQSGSSPHSRIFCSRVL